MITIREYLAFLTFLAVCVGGLTPIYRWWRKKEDAADAEEGEARLSERQNRSTEEARSREIRDERSYREAKLRELRRAMDIPNDADASGQSSSTASPPVGASGLQSTEAVPADDPTESLLNEALGPALTPN